VSHQAGAALQFVKFLKTSAPLVLQGSITQPLQKTALIARLEKQRYRVIKQNASQIFPAIS
jgi:hypothetical protein